MYWIVLRIKTYSQKMNETSIFYCESSLESFITILHKKLNPYEYNIKKKNIKYTNKL